MTDRLEQELEKARAFFRKVAEGIIIAMAKEARGRIAALEGELELARQGQRDARAGMDHAISKGRGEAANFCDGIAALLKERDEARARIAELERDHNKLRQLYTEQTIKFQALERELLGGRFTRSDGGLSG